MHVISDCVLALESVSLTPIRADEIVWTTVTPWWCCLDQHCTTVGQMDCQQVLCSASSICHKHGIACILPPHAAECRDRQTDRQTLYHYTDPAVHTVQAVPITQQFPVKHLQPTDWLKVVGLSISNTRKIISSSIAKCRKKLSNKANLVSGIIRYNKKLSYRRVTARCGLSVVILPIATQQCRNYLYDKSWPNWWHEVGGLVRGNVS